VVTLVMAWSPAWRSNAKWFEVEHPGDYATLNSYQPRDGTIGIGILLCGLNIVGVSGFLSQQYERQVLESQAVSHTSEQTARASASLVERQLAAAESNLAQSRTQLIRAKDDKHRIRAAQAIITTATTERDSLVKQLASAQTTEAKVEGQTITAGSEMSAIAFLAGATGWSMGTVAHLVILILSSIPDVLACLLIVASGYSSEEKREAPVKQEVAAKLTKRQIGARRGWEKRRQRAYAANHKLAVVRQWISPTKQRLTC
jgi:hypothetical protein